MKKIYFHSHFKPHSLYNSLFEFGIPGYEFIKEDNQTKESLIRKILSKTKLLALLKPLIKIFINPISTLDKKFSKKTLPEDTSLIFSTGHLILRKDVPWILDVVDKVTTLTGYDYKRFLKEKENIKKILLNPNLKKIICFTEACKKDFSDEFQSSEINNKIEVINLAKPLYPKKKIIRKRRKDVNLLFMGSINNPQDFLIKGGLETLETFRILSEKYGNLHLFVRCIVPKEIKSKYSNIPRLHIIEETLSQKEIDSLYKLCDVFMAPAHNINGLAPLEAMGYSMPLIGIDTWAADELIIHNVNGFLVKKSDKIPYLQNKIHLDVKNEKFLNRIKFLDKEFIERLVQKTELLIKNYCLRKKFGNNGRKMVENGKFSFKLRQKKFRRVFDAACN